MKEKKDMNRKRAIRARQRKQRNRRIALVLCVMFAVLAVSVGGTVAWLMDETSQVVNTFTAGDISIELTETTTNFKMVPGNTIAKDPKVTVKAGSEACWLFVKVERSENFNSFIDYAIAGNGWFALGLTETEAAKYDVFYREVTASDKDQSFDVLEDNQVTVWDHVTKGQLNGLTDATRPTLTFTAYAIQKDNISTATDAWAKISNPGA